MRQPHERPGTEPGCSSGTLQDTHPARKKFRTHRFGQVLACRSGCGCNRDLGQKGESAAVEDAQLQLRMTRVVPPQPVCREDEAALLGYRESAQGKQTQQADSHQ